jgi:histone demethylase JARID1
MSVNYLHVGQPRTWYVIPGHQRNLFEEVFLELVPELVKIEPDLLNSIVTTFPPEELTSKGLEILQVNQYAGEFIITFPKSTYSYFSHGVRHLLIIPLLPSLSIHSISRSITLERV